MFPAGSTVDIFQIFHSDPSPMDSTPATFKGPSMAPWFLANASMFMVKNQAFV